MTARPSRLRRPFSTTLLTIAVLTGMLVAAPAANAAVLTQSLGGDVTAASLAGALVGNGVTVSNAQFTGANIAGGTFSGGGTGPTAIIGFEQGVILSTGAIANVIGPNTVDDATTINAVAGDADLNSLLPAGSSTDAAVLTFTFVPDASSVSFRYVFSSEEYNEFVNQGFNDVFGFFVNGSNCATVGGQPVSVDTVNGGNPLGTDASNPSLFRNNSTDPGPATIDTQMDGLTTVLTCIAAVSANEPNTMKLAIGDVGDASYDSDVFIEAGSLTTEPPTDVPGAPTDVAAVGGNGSATVTWAAPASDGGSPIDGYTATCTASGNPDDSHSGTTDGSARSTAVGGLTNGVEYACQVSAHNVNGDSDPSAASAPFTPAVSGGGSSMTINTGTGGLLVITPDVDLGTRGKIKVPPQAGPATDVVVTASLFGTPGEHAITCGGNACVGQGIEWSVSDPEAITKMFVKFFIAQRLTHGASVSDVPVYKDGIPLPNCSNIRTLTVGHQVKPVDETPCVARRHMLSGGGWRISVMVDGSDPRGRI